MKDVNLPALIENTLPVLQELTSALGVSRDMLSSDEEIESAWKNLPRIIKKIPPQLRTEELVRMCVAVATGLFDSGINYIWNAAVIELREKVKRFGLKVVRQVIEKDKFDNQALLELQDSELLDLCLKLNLITEDGYFFLDQCRDIRNNFSAAHPAVGKLDDNEFLSFVNRCAKYALGNEINPVGVDIQSFVTAIKGIRFSKDQRDEWVQRLSKTHEAQLQLLIGTLHGLYCDPSSSEEARLNAYSIASQFSDNLSPKIVSELIDRHQEYLAKGDEKRHQKSQQFFEKLGLLELLGEGERHSIISNACKHLYNVHMAFDNFYNEPPFAERLLHIASQGSMPDTAKQEYVEVVLTCAIGNQYGISRAAYPYYVEMVKGFTPKELAIFLELPETRSIVGNRIRSYGRCWDAFKRLVALIDPESVPVKAKKAYKEWQK
jgi:hypothetical protein